MSQLEYGYNTPVGLPGMKYSSQFDHVISRAAEVAIPTGSAVEPGENPETQVVPYAGGLFAGIALDDGLRSAEYLSDDPAAYLPTDPVSVLRKGACWVEVAADVEALSPAYVTADGEFTGVGGEDGEAIGQFVTSATAGGLAAVEINLP